ncbi:MAG: Uncharacterized protein XD78_2036 [Desulfotomaculum sp. 46_296]|nr:MAG: Uncharacterized protein XD78_2036 [Desulfotomaculum sp. 46_296]HAU31376.1 hypothetical protein [Desulfotomaculum sp.]
MIWGDMGDNWEQEIQLMRMIEYHDKESPYLLEASGQTPPGDVGGVGGFVNFREVMLNPNHPEYSLPSFLTGMLTRMVDFKLD